MKFRKSRKAPQPTQARHLERQTNEILDLVLSEVRLQGFSGLLGICSASRQFYILTIPHLYRDVFFTLDQASHIRLLRRLQRPDCQIPKMIRYLYVSCWKEEDLEHLPSIKRVFDNLAHLEELEWFGPFQMPSFMLDTLHTRFPDARLNTSLLKMKNESSVVDDQLSSATVHLFLQPAVSTLTHLNITLSAFDLFWTDATELWEGFESDLIHMLIRNTALINLQVVAKGLIEPRRQLRKSFMMAELLPKLEELRLYVENSPIFEHDELLHWGTRGGWENLTYLGLFHLSSLIPFIGKTPRLEALCLLPRNGEDVADFKSHLDNLDSSCSFPALFNVKTRAPWDHGLPVQYADQLIPWDFLDLLPLTQLTMLDVTRPQCLGPPSTSVPSAEDVRKIRTKCPSLEKLAIDLYLPWGSRHGRWPNDVVKELAVFQTPIELIILLVGNQRGVDEGWLEPARYLRFVIRSSLKIVACLWRERKRQKELVKIPFSADFTWYGQIWCENYEVAYDNCDDWNFGIEIREGNSRAYHRVRWLTSGFSNRSYIINLPLEELEAKSKFRWKYLLQNRGRYKDEIRHRKKLDKAGKGGYEPDATLYDLLMQADSDEVGA